MKKLLEVIKLIFKKISNKTRGRNEEIIDNDKEEIIIEEQIVKNINWNLIKKISNFDIVLVKMTDEEIKSNNIQESHQKRPFLVKEKDDLKQLVQGYYLTSNVSGNAKFKSEKHNGLKLVLNKDNYKLNKNSLVLFNKEISVPYENINMILGCMNSEDLKKFKKYIKLIRKNVVISNKENKVIEIGDIVFFEGLRYIIYQMDNTNCYGYFIMELKDKKDVEKDHNFITFNNRIYFIEYKNNQIFDNNDDLQIVDRFNDSIVETIKENKKILKLEDRKNKKRC